MIISDKSIKKALQQRQLRATQAFDVHAFLFKEQLAFIEDPSRNKIAVCSRRSGKTVSCAADLVRTALETPGVVCLYITLSRNNAKKIIWREINKINRDYNLNGVENLSELSITFPNKPIIYLSGAKDSNEIEKFRGLALKLVYIDEAQSYREYLGTLIDDILAPALIDYAGTLVMIGTPPPIPVGYFCEAYQEENGWSKHHWTFWDNPFIPTTSKMTHQATMEHELKRRGVDATHPSIQREFFGKFAFDSDSLLLNYNPAVNHYDGSYKAAKPDHTKWDYIMGIDLGFDDSDAIAVLAWTTDSPKTYLVEELVVPQQGITELAAQVDLLRKKYDITKMVIDQGGLGKKIAEELRRRYSIPVEAAEKTRKMENIAIMNDALRTGNLMAKKDSKFANDSYLVEIDKDKSTPDKIAVSNKFHSDIIDSVLYAFKFSPAFAYQPPIVKPKWGSKEWQDAQNDELFEKAQNHFSELASFENAIKNYGSEE